MLRESAPDEDFDFGGEGREEGVEEGVEIPDGGPSVRVTMMVVFLLFEGRRRDFPLFVGKRAYLWLSKVIGKGSRVLS